MIDKKLTPGLQMIANGVFVISAEHRGQVRGFTATWVSQVSFEHPLVMASVSKTHDTYPLIVSSNKFVINVLGASQVDIARHFGRSKTVAEDDSDYFLREGDKTLPVLKEAIAVLECDIHSTHDAKDHTIFVAEVTRADVRREEEPLIFWRKGKYAKPARLT